MFALLVSFTSARIDTCGLTACCFLYVKPKGILSLQKHHHRAEHWLVTQGNAKITLNKDIITKKPGEHIFIPLEAIHRVQNPGKKPVKIVEAQVGSILKETDIVRYQDVYGRVK